MAKDYFQDIVPPPGDNPPQRRVRRPVAPPPPAEPEEVDEAAEDEYTDDDLSTEDTEPVAAPRGIRNINMPARPRSLRVAASGIGGGDMREVPPIGHGLPQRPRRRSSRLWLWVVVVVCVLALGFFALFMFKQTTITLTPRSQSVTFDQTAQFTAYPQATAATGTLSYTVATTEFADSETVQGNGTTATQMKASGNITVYNDYSAASVKLIANTRFETSSGLIFRTPAAIVIPGKTAKGPGSVQVTVIADQAGTQYNIGPTSFTVPGLQSTPAEYKGIYAQSTGSMTGGFSGNQEGVSDSVRQSAVADIRTRLAADVAQYVQSQNTADSVAFASLAETTYSDMPDTDASSSTEVQINESVQVQLPVFPAAAFADAVTQTMGVDADSSAVTIVGGNGYGAQSNDPTPVNLGTDPVDFALVGNADVVWTIDTVALARALAGRNQSSFETIIGSFPGIESARARIEPFWMNSFPSDPAKIKITVESPGTDSTQQVQPVVQSTDQPAIQPTGEAPMQPAAQSGTPAGTPGTTASTQ